MGLKFQFKGKVVIIGIGNLLRADDGFGPALIELIQGRLDAVCIDAGTAPENYIGKIAKLKPETVLIVDAVELNSEAGTYAILRKSDIIKSGFTTHDISPSMFIEYLEKETNADIFMLGVQPENIRLGEEMSDKVKKTLEEIFVILTNNLRRKK
ncbi:MAG: hydrogenase maturation peptidase HycI [Candidatus Omnitrophota bacterium]